ncbi:NADH-quinone oxidoreductase subunit F, partial [Roseomonas alkaliterrae]
MNAREATPRRGRRSTPEAREAVQAALSGMPLRRDLLIEHLHRLQDRHGALREGHLVALAEALRLAPVEVFEVATFYAHFEVLPDEAAAPRPVIRVCQGLPCAMAGAATLASALRASPPGGARILDAPCMGACDRAPAAALGHACIGHATPARLAAPAVKEAGAPGLEDY